MLPIDQGFSLGTKGSTGGVASRCRGVSLTTVKPCLVWYFSYLMFPVFRGAGSPSPRIPFPPKIFLLSTSDRQRKYVTFKSPVYYSSSIRGKIYHQGYYRMSIFYRTSIFYRISDYTNRNRHIALTVQKQKLRC